MIQISDMLQIVGKLKYIVFLLLGIYFIIVGEIIPKFEMKRTTFAENREPISELPTIMSYVKHHEKKKLAYGKDLTLTYAIAKAGSQQSPLALGKNVLNGSLVLQLEKLYLTPFDSGFKIRPLNFPSKVDLDFQLIWNLILNDTSDDQSKVMITMSLSTENNSIPCISHNLRCDSGGYKDGNVNVIVAKPSQTGYYAIYPEKYIYLQETNNCRTHPYNELILIETLKKITTGCSYPCRPKISNGKELDNIISDLPLCRNENEVRCFAGIVAEAEEIVPNEPCTKVEYRVDGFTHPENTDTNKAIFTFQFGSGSVGVKEQYIVYDAVAMISAIGGTMGLCIGFSFNDTFNYLLSYLETGINWWTRPRSRNSKNIQETVNTAKPNKHSSNGDVSKLVDLEMRISSIEQFLNLAKK